MQEKQLKIIKNKVYTKSNNTQNIVGDIMNKEIDLSKYKLRTDLAIELIEEANNINIIESKENDIKISSVEIKNNAGNAINKKDGLYITIEFDDITDMNNQKNIENILTKEIKTILDYTQIKDTYSALIVGLGNKDSTPDALGPLVIENIITTNHLFELNVVSPGFRKTYKLSPGVKSNSGIETKDYIKAIINQINVDFVIVIDALASRSIERLNKTIQISSTGISPGSGVGNNREEISYDTLGIPVIAIGVPTVVDAATIVSDTINFLYKYYAYNRLDNIKKINKLSLQKSNYLKKNITLSDLEKTRLFGVIGTLNEDEIYKLISEVLEPINYNLMVTTKEIDFLIKKISDTISNTLNKTLHRVNLLK